MSRALLVLIFGLMLVAFAGPAQAERRVALVVGISKYKLAPPLGNPVHDATAMAALFRNAGFDVVDEEHDIGVLGLRRAIREFSEKAEDADIAVVYYAGHGIEVDGSNYLVPADAKLVRDFDVEDEAISLDRVLKSLEPVKRLRLVILDACRDNPFANTIKKSVATRSIGRGLAKVEPTTPNTLVAFATKAGAIAEDGRGEDSQYTAALVKYITEPGVDVRVAFGRVRDEVLQKTANRQEPFVYGSLGGDNLALVPQPAKPVDTEAGARTDYEYAAQLGTREVWNSYLAKYPNGFYADLARAQVKKLTAAEQSQAIAETARQEAEDQAAQKAAKLQKSVEEQAANRVAAANQQLATQSKELDEAKKQAELAQQRAEAARQEVEQVRRQAVEEARQQTDQARNGANENGAKVATLTTAQPLTPSPAPPIDQADISRLLQAHLKRVGCNPGKVDGEWDQDSRRSLELFNRNAKTNFDTKVASLEALDAVRNQTDRVCPLDCDRGERAVGDRCVEIGRHREAAPPKSRSMAMRLMKRHGFAPAALAPALPSAAPSGNSCALDSFGHRSGGRFCRD